MARLTRCLLALAVLSSPAVALAQDATSASARPPRVELGAGGGMFYSGGTMPFTTGMLDTRVGVTLSRKWSVEGFVHFLPDGGANVSGYYRAQAVWRIGGGRIQPFLAFGGAGEFNRYSMPEYHYNDDYTGEPRVIPATSGFNISAPWYPTAAIGFEKIVSPHLKVRAELTTAFGLNDYGIAMAFLPAASISIPIGRYRTDR